MTEPHEDLNAVRPEMTALGQDDLLQITVEPLTAASLARGVLPGLMVLREQLSQLAGFDIQNLDKLERYARAATQANSIYLGASAPPERFQALVAEATTLREQLLSDATALSNRSVINGEKLAELKGPIGHRNVASDVLTLVYMFRGNWANVAGKTCVTLAELEHAEAVGDQLVGDIGLRARAPAALAAYALERQQAYTLFVNAYDEVRRAVTYLRWREGDADDIAPSLFGGRRRKSSSDAETKTEPVHAPTNTPTVTAPVPGTPAVAPKAAIGLPGADPFVH